MTRIATASRPASKTAPKPGARRSPGPDAMVVLREDHKRVGALFKQYERTKDDLSSAEKSALAGEICRELTVHATLEEEILYPAARAALAEDGEELLDEAEVEHAIAKEMITWIEAASPDDPLYDAKVTVLGEYVRHHVEEEHDETFPRCRKSSMDLKAVGAAIVARKAELIADA